MLFSKIGPLATLGTRSGAPVHRDLILQVVRHCVYIEKSILRIGESLTNLRAYEVVTTGKFHHFFSAHGDALLASRINRSSRFSPPGFSGLLTQLKTFFFTYLVTIATIKFEVGFVFGHHLFKLFIVERFAVDHSNFSFIAGYLEDAGNVLPLTSWIRNRKMPNPMRRLTLVTARSEYDQ
jgi:hypothetical protein